MEKKGQVAILIIIALAIIVILLGVFLYPRIKEVIAPEIVSPQLYLESCIEPEVKNAVQLIASRGGVENPPAYLEYEGKRARYLCYNSQYYQKCVVQEPMLVPRFEEELIRILTPKAETCARNMRAEFEKRGYDVKMPSIKTNISLAYKKISILFNIPATITKEDFSQTINVIDASIDSNIYEILSIAVSIVDFETTYGDSEITAYMKYYPNIKIEKRRLDDNIKLYIITDTTTKEEFAFASRSIAWPQGLLG